MWVKGMALNDRLVAHIPVQDAAQYPDVYGVEVELEGKAIKNCPKEVHTYWTQHVDNSLRVIKDMHSEATEYVSRYPLNMEETKRSIQTLFAFLTKPGVEVYESYRTSIHVHVNFAQEDFRTIYNFMTLSLILDELLVSQNGEHRIGNNFCLRAKDAMGQVVALVTSISQGSEFFSIAPNDRYSSINFASLMKFGSIEFRSLECTTHEGRLMHWIGALARIKEHSKGFKNPMEIVQQFSMMGPREFLVSTMGPFAFKYLNVPNFDGMLYNGVRIAQDLAYASTWSPK